MNCYCEHYVENLVTDRGPKLGATKFPYHTVILWLCDECLGKFKVLPK